MLPLVLSLPHATSPRIFFLSFSFMHALCIFVRVGRGYGGGTEGSATLRLVSLLFFLVLLPHCCVIAQQNRGSWRSSTLDSMGWIINNRRQIPCVNPVFEGQRGMSDYRLVRCRSLDNPSHAPLNHVSHFFFSLALGSTAGLRNWSPSKSSTSRTPRMRSTTSSRRSTFYRS